MASIRTSFLALFTGLFLAFSLVACNVALPGTSGPVAPCAVTVSQEAATRFIQRVQSQTNVKGKTITLTASSQEITSLVAVAIQQAQANAPGVTIPLEQPVVCFKKGEMSIFGIINPDGSHPINALFSVDAGVTDGKATFRVQQAQVGSFAVPTEVGDAVSGLIDQALSQSLARLNLLRITIQDNQISLTGTVQ